MTTAVTITLEGSNTPVEIFEREPGSERLNPLRVLDKDGESHTVFVHQNNQVVIQEIRTQNG